MASQVDIANLALTKLGASRIASLTDNNKSARAIAAVYEMTRKAELRKAFWQFSIKRTTLPALADAPAFGFGTAFQLPADYIRAVQIGDTYVSPAQSDYITQDNSPFRIEGNTILTDFGAPLKLRYVFDATDPGTYDPLFVKCFACMLAYEACEEVTNSSAKRQQMQDDYTRAKAEAALVGAIEQPAQGFADDSWMVARL